jgi:hypothetical protein
MREAFECRGVEATFATRKYTHLDDVGMVQFTEVLDFPHGRHIEAILELAHLNLLNGNLATRRELPA